MSGMDLVDFLKARLDEDAQIARDCVGDDLGWAWTGSGGHVKDADGCAVVAVEDYGQEVVPHIARHDPARVLADVAAKREILRNHEDIHDCGDPESYADPYVGCRDLRLLALPYVEQADYRDEWKP